jgi:hypothetical protein
MKRYVVPVVVLFALMSTHVGSAQLPNLNELMQQKLEHGQNLLEAIVQGDPVSVERYANELTLLSEASTWTSLRTPEYLQYASWFRDASRQLVAEAQDRNTERMTFAYTELVTTCVQCHRHVRGAQQAD